MDTGDVVGRLKGRGLQSRIGARQQRGDAKQKERTRLAERDKQKPWRRWYKTAEWQDLRLEVLTRDGYVCQQTGVALVGVHPAPNSPVVDHKKAHRGDHDLFWDSSNLQAVSKEWHDKVKQRQEWFGLD